MSAWGWPLLSLGTGAAGAAIGWAAWAIHAGWQARRLHCDPWQADGTLRPAAVALARVLELHCGIRPRRSWAPLLRGLSRDGRVPSIEEMEALVLGWTVRRDGDWSRAVPLRFPWTKREVDALIAEKIALTHGPEVR